MSTMLTTTEPLSQTIAHELFRADRTDVPATPMRNESATDTSVSQQCVTPHRNVASSVFEVQNLMADMQPEQLQLLHAMALQLHGIQSKTFAMNNLPSDERPRSDMSPSEHGMRSPYSAMMSPGPVRGMDTPNISIRRRNHTANPPASPQSKDFDAFVGRLKDASIVPESQAQLMALINKRRLTDEQLETLVAELCPHAKALCSDQHGLGVVFAMFQLLRDQRPAIFQQMVSQFVDDEELMLHLCKNVWKFVMFLLQNTSELLDNPVVKLIKTHIRELAMDKTGCITITRVGHECSQVVRTEIALEVLGHAIDLSYNEYGNYVVQFVLENCQLDVASTVVETWFLKPANFERMAKNKFASPVLEKALKFVAPSTKQEIFRLMFTKPESPEMIRGLADDQFGNYVVQRAIEMVSLFPPHERAQCFHVMQNIINGCQGTKYHTKISTKLRFFLNKAGVRDTSVSNVMSHQNSSHAMMQSQMHNTRSPKPNLHGSHSNTQPMINPAPMHANESEILRQLSMSNINPMMLHAQQMAWWKMNMGMNGLDFSNPMFNPMLNMQLQALMGMNLQMGLPMGLPSPGMNMDMSPMQSPFSAFGIPPTPMSMGEASPGMQR